MTTENYSMVMLTVGAILLLLVGADLVLRSYERRRPQLVQPLLEKQSIWFDVGLFVLTWIAFFLLNNHKFIDYNNYSYLSEALLKGRLDSPNIPSYLESIELDGKIYMHFAPGVSLMILPFVSLFGITGFNYAYFGITLGAANAVLFYHILLNLKIGKNNRERLLCTLFAIFGTVHCFLAAISHSWFIGHVSSWFCLFFAMYLATCTYKKKVTQNIAMFFGGLLFGLAVCCRLSNLLGAGFFIGYFVLFREKKDWLRIAVFFAIGAAIFGCFYMGMNYVRFGTIMDKSYNLTHLKDYFKPLYFYMQDNITGRDSQMAFLNAVEKRNWATAFPTAKEQLSFIEFLQKNINESWNYCKNLVPTASLSSASSTQVTKTFNAIVDSCFKEVGGPLALKSIKYNSYSIFCMMPTFKNEFPYIIPEVTGVSLTAISPVLYFFIVPLITKRKKPFIWVLFGTMIITAIPFLLNYGNGTSQFGMRYAMDFLPYMILLACMGLTYKGMKSWKTVLIALCMFANIWGPVFWNAFLIQ